MLSSKIRAYTMAMVRDNHLYCLPSEIGTNLTCRVRWMHTERGNKTIGQTCAKCRRIFFEYPCSPFSCGSFANCLCPVAWWWWVATFGVQAPCVTCSGGVGPWAFYSGLQRSLARLQGNRIPATHRGRSAAVGARCSLSAGLVGVQDVQDLQLRPPAPAWSTAPT